MSKLMKKLSSSKNVTISVKMDILEVMGPAVVDKDMFCVHWTMKGLRGRENTGETENVRAGVSEGQQYPLAAFPNVFSGEVQVRPRKDGSGYDQMDFEMRVSQPALHKKDEKILGKAIINIFEKVPTLTEGQPTPAEQTVILAKDGSAVAHVKFTFQIGNAPAIDDTQAEIVDAGQPSESEPPHLVVKTPPATPQKEAGSESGSVAPSEGKEETESKRTHRKRRSSNSSAMAQVALKKKEEELKQKETEFEEEKKKLNDEIAQQKAEIDQLKLDNQHLGSRVKELEQAKEQTDVVPIDPAEQQMQENLARLQAQNEELQEQKIALLDSKEQSDKKVKELTEALEAAKKELEEAKNKPESDEKDKELALLKDQIAELRAELGKKAEGEGEPATASAPAKNNMMMMGIIGAAGAVLGIIIGLFI